MDGDWGVILITAAGIILSFVVGALPQWKKEKWAWFHNTNKTVVLMRGNGGQHAIIIIGDSKGLDLETLATGPSKGNFSASYNTGVTMTVLAALWIFLPITAWGLKANSWYILAIGAIVMVQNIL